MKEKTKEAIKENIYNVPNFLTALRGFGAIVLAYLVFADYSKITLAIVFAVFAITDGIDGFVARKFNQRTNFGKYFDPVMDRIFMISFVICLIIKFGIINNELAFKFLPFIMTREIVSLPAYIFLRKGDFKIDVKPIGKLATFTQSVTLPIMLLDTNIAVLLISITCLAGLFSGITYTIDSYNAIINKGVANVR